MSFRYSVGLQNVGSYQVSGQPWLKSASFTGVQSAFYEFPNVTDHIKITNDIAAAGTGNLDIVFCEPKRAVDFGGTAEYLNATFSTTDQLTASAWIKMQGSMTGLRLLEISGGNALRVQTDGTPRLRLHVNGSNATDTTTTLTVGTWINITLVANGTANKMYLNGSLLKTNTTQAGTGFTSIAIGGSAAGYDGIYDELVLFSTAFSDEEVAELYNEGKTLKTSNHSRSAELVSRWDFEDNGFKTFYTTPDATNLIYDRVSTNNLTLTNGSTPLVFKDGRLLENALERHKVTLIGQQEIQLNCKSRQVFLRSTGTTAVNVHAPLTGIPANRMFELTGTGIDE